MSRRRTVSAALLALTLAVPVVVADQAINAPAAEAELWRDSQFWLDDYGVREAWETTRGEGVTIAVIDTGIDAEHPTLAGAVTGGMDVSGGGDASGGPVEQTSTQHGTLVASLLAGRGQPAEEANEGTDLDELSDDEWDDWFDEFVADLEDTYGEDFEDEIDQERLDEFYETRRLPGVDEDNDSDADEDDAQDYAEDLPDSDLPSGVVGVAPAAELLSVSLVLEDPNPHGPTTEDQIAQAVTWAVDQGADIINMSIGSGSQEWPESWDEAFLYAEQNDVLVVAAAGNRAAGHFSVGAPATIPGVLTVAGVNQDRGISEESSSQGIAVDLAAASEPLVGAVPGGGNAFWEGTSGATPIVAGAAALVMAAHPELSAPEVAHRLQASADSAGAPGVDPEYGYGVLNVAAAVTGDVPQFDPAQADTLEDWIRVHRRSDAEPAEHEDIPEDSGVVPGPEGEPRAAPRASEMHSAQDWAGPVTLGVAGLVLVFLMTAAVGHLWRRRDNKS